MTSTRRLPRIESREREPYPWPLKVLLFLGVLLLLLIHAPYVLWNALKFEWDK